MAPLDISLCMIVKDEELHLDRCLSSVNEIVSEIIVADTGSQDGTVELARRHGAKIIHVPWEDDFAKARNASLEHASCSWILVLDADEEAVNWEAEEVSQLLREERVYGYFLQLESRIGEGGPQEYVTDAVCRLFRSDPRIRFRGTIHEEAVQSMMELSERPVSFAGLRIRHYGYLPEEIERKHKNARNLALIERALQQQPGDWLLRYAEGTEYFQAERYAAAAERLLPLLEELHAGPEPGFASDMYLKTAYALFQTEQLETMERVIRDGLARFPDFPGLLELKASMLQRAGAYDEAYAALRQAIRMGDRSFKYTSLSGSGTYRTHAAAGQLCERLLRFETALDHYFETVAINPGYRPAWPEVVTLSLLSGRAERLPAWLAQLEPGSLTPDHASLLFTAVLSARAPETASSLLALPQLAGLRLDVRLPHALLHWQAGRREAAELIWLALRDEQGPGVEAARSYLWAAAWARMDAPAAAQALAPLGWERADTPLAELQRLMAPQAADADRPRVSGDALGYALRRLIQLGAWEALLRLYAAACSEGAGGAAGFRWTRLPQPFWCGLATAPASIRERWCRLFIGTVAPAPGAAGSASAASDAAEALLFAAMARGGAAGPEGPRRLRELLQRHPQNPAARAGLAYAYWLEAQRLMPEGSQLSQAGRGPAAGVWPTTLGSQPAASAQPPAPGTRPAASTWPTAPSPQPAASAQPPAPGSHPAASVPADDNPLSRICLSDPMGASCGPWPLLLLARASLLF